MEILSKVQALVAKQLNIKIEDVTSEKEIVRDLGADSLDVVEMLMSLEDDFGITVPDEETVNIKTVGDIASILGKYAK